MRLLLVKVYHRKDFTNYHRQFYFQTEAIGEEVGEQLARVVGNLPGIGEVQAISSTEIAQCPLHQF